MIEPKIIFQQEYFSREDYIQACKQAFNDFSKNHKILIQYVYRKKKKWATIVSFVVDKLLYMGISKCNFKHDNFNKYIGIINAINNASYYSYGPRYVVTKNKIFFDAFTRSIIYFRILPNNGRKWNIDEFGLKDQYKIKNWLEKYPELFYDREFSSYRKQM